MSISSSSSSALTSKSLTVTNDSYDVDYTTSELYWTYTAVKNDNYFKTGEVTEETALADKGLPSSLPGTYSVGDWVFTFNAYTSDDMTTDDDEDGVPDSLYYQGTGSSVTLYPGVENTVPVSVSLVEATGDYGTVTFSGIYFVSVDDEGNETVETLGVSSLEDAGVTLSVLIDDEEITTDTSVLDTSKVLASSSETSSGSVTVTVTTGNHTVQVILYSSDGTVLAESSVTVFVKPNLDTAVTGSLEVVTADAEIGTITVSTDGTTIIYTLSADT